MKILIVDDEPDVVQMIDLQIKGAGYDTCITRDGNEALRKVVAEKPDLIILDIIMPQLDGFGVYKALRGLKDTAKIPIIILTARGKMEDSFKVLGVDEFIAKPFDMDRLLASVDRLLKAKAKPAVSPPPPQPVKAGNKDNVLIVGHLSDPLNKLIAYLKTKNKEIFVVQSDEEALSKCSALKPKAVIMDTYLNDSSAEDAVKLISQEKSLRDIPIILYSYIDTESLGGESLSERLMSIETAKDNCLSAGAMTYAGQLTDANFANLVFLSIP